MSLLKKRWPNAWYHDPAYNPNLTLSKVDYDRSMQPRTLLNTRHWPSPFAAGYVAPKSSGLRLLLALPEKGPDSRPLAFARVLLRQGLIQSSIGIMLCMTIIGIPFGLQCFKIAAIGMIPFGSRGVSESL